MRASNIKQRLDKLQDQIGVPGFCRCERCCTLTKTFSGDSVSPLILSGSYRLKGAKWKRLSPLEISEDYFEKFPDTCPICFMKTKEPLNIPRTILVHTDGWTPPSLPVLDSQEGWGAKN